MPVVFDASKVLDPNPSVRAAHSYQAALDYAQNRLTGAEFTNLQAELTSAGMPTDSNDVLALPNPWEYASGLRDIVMRFVSQHPINPTTISTVPGAVAADLTVDDEINVSGAFTAGSINSQGNVIAGGSIIAQVGVAANGEILASGNGLFVGGVRVGTFAGVNPGSLSAQLRVEAKGLVLTEQRDEFDVLAGGFAEDTNGDFYYKNLSGRVVYLNRPNHDTGWLPLNVLHPAIGLVGGPAPQPAQTPDIYAATPMTFAALPGDPGGPVNMALWLRADTSLVDGGPVTGNFYHFIITPFQSGAAAAGGQLVVDTVNLQLAIELAPNAIVPGQTLITTAAAAGLVDVRAMVWVR